ncbi:MAG: hypothetical protein IPK99_04555 [Flavobacteriales bacterium]|nr:hypothetical protein [Flavobacteriales bacterium]
MILRAAVVLLVAGGLWGCSRTAEGAKEVINKGGEIAGTVATEFVEGAASGAEATWAVEVDLDERLANAGLAAGKVIVDPNDASGRANSVAIYLTAKATLNDTITAVAYDNNGAEIGRVRQPPLAAGAADYATFQFQDLTDLGRKGRVLLR